MTRRHNADRYAPDMQAPDREPWMDGALCAQMGDFDVFFPPKGHPSREAKDICSRCDVISECALYALTNTELQGIWGGLSDRDRIRMRRDGPAGVICPTCGGRFVDLVKHRYRAPACRVAGSAA